MSLSPAKLAIEPLHPREPANFWGNDEAKLSPGFRRVVIGAADSVNASDCLAYDLWIGIVMVVRGNQPDYFLWSVSHCPPSY
jgi:hypothetical protein